MKKTRLVSLMLCALMASSVAACSGKGGGDQLPPEAEGKTVLKVAVYEGGLGTAWMTQAAEAFGELYKDKSFEEGKTGVYVDVQAHKQFNGSTLLTGSIDKDLYFTEDVNYYTHVSRGNFADITDVMTGSLEEYGETGTVADKLTENQRSYLTARDGKYYGVPFYDGIYGLIYDRDMFSDNYWFFDENGDIGVNENGIDPNGSDLGLSKGPDNKADTAYDNGLPATYDQFADLMYEMTAVGKTPFAYMGSDSAYIKRAMNSWWSDYEGLDAMNVNYTLDGTIDVVTAINDGEVTTESVKIDQTNGYRLHQQAGKYYALKFLEILLGGGDNYKASDVSGNVTEKEVQVLCAVSGEPIVLETTDVAQTVAAYETVKIGGVASLTGTGGNGNLQYSAKVVSPSGEEVKVVDNSFLATEMGVYQVVYTATDYLGASASKTVEIIVERPSKPIFTSALYLPDKLVNGFEYTLPTQIAQEASGNDMVEVPVSVYVNGEKNTTGKFTATGASVEIKYVANGATGESQRAETLEVVDGNNGKDQEKYFFGENLTAITNERDYVSVSMNGDANVSFINTLNSYNFRFAYSFADQSNLSVMKIKLTDAADKTLSATMTLTKRGQAWSLTTPHNKVEAQFTDAQGNFEFIYKNDTFGITDKNAKSCGVVSYYDNGDPFEGFSDKVYLNVAFENVFAESTIRFMQLNNQPLGYRTTKFESRRDRIAPELKLSNAWAVKNTIGDKVMIAGGQAYDVLG